MRTEYDFTGGVRSTTCPAGEGEHRGCPRSIRQPLPRPSEKQQRFCLSKGVDIVLTGLDVDVTLNVADATRYVVLRHFLLVRSRYAVEVCNMDQFGGA